VSRYAAAHCVASGTRGSTTRTRVHSIPSIEGIQEYPLWYG
jgi:hypothetical protein